jgi:hypothetical protein
MPHEEVKELLASVWQIAHVSTFPLCVAEALGHWTSEASYVTLAPRHPSPLSTVGGQQVWGWRRCRDITVQCHAEGGARCDAKC